MSDNLSTGVVNSEIQSRVLEKICSKLPIQEIDGTSPLHNIIRQIVKKEVEQQLKDLNNGKCYFGADSSSCSRNLELKFSCNVLETIWTAEYIKGEGNNSILVTLFDSGKVVEFGPEASGKVEVVILKGSFDTDDWTTEEFNQNIIKEMNGKNILKGNAVLELKDGIGALGNLSILHNRTWKRVSMLRLGARFMDSFPNIKVREAKTKIFTMKDRRMKGSRKGAKLLSLVDKVWCLKHIGKCQSVVDRLTKEGIQSIEDFLKLYFLRLEDLQRILGHGWTETKMKATIDHALKCKGSMALKRDVLSNVKSPFDNKEVVWDDSVPPLVSPTCSFLNGPFSSSPMMGENVGAERYARSCVKSSFDNKEEGVVWDTAQPLVSPTCVSPIGLFSSPSSMMGENVGAEAVVGSPFVSSEVPKNRDEPTNTTITWETFCPYNWNNIFQQDALSHVKSSSFDIKEVVWDDTVQPLASSTCASFSNGPFYSSSSSMMDENICAMAVLGSTFVSSEMSNGHDPTTTGEISSNEHWDAIGDEGNINMGEFNWNDDNMLFRVPSFNYMDHKLRQFDDLGN